MKIVSYNHNIISNHSMIVYIGRSNRIVIINIFRIPVLIMDRI